MMDSKTTRWAQVLFLVCLGLSLAKAQVHTVSAVPGLADFGTLQEAMDVATFEDTIYVYPGDYTLADGVPKALTIIGPGYFRTNNGLLSNNLLAGNAKFDNFHVNQDLNGVVEIIGCQISKISLENALDVTIKRCYITGDFDATWSNNISVINCFFDDPCGDGNKRTRLTNGSTFNIQNNIFKKCGEGVVVDGTSSGIIMNNYFASFTNIFSFNNSLVKNNIFAGSNVLTETSTNYVASYNLKRSAHCFGTNCQVFSGSPTVDVGSFDLRYQLSNNSIGVGAGENGVDCGPFGGDFPYQLSGLPAIPLIYDLDMPDNAPAGQPLPVNVKVRTQN